MWGVWDKERKDEGGNGRGRRTSEGIIVVFTHTQPSSLPHRAWSST